MEITRKIMFGITAFMFSLIAASFPISAFAQVEDSGNGEMNEYFRAEVLSVEDVTDDQSEYGLFQSVRKVSVMALSGSLEGEVVEADQYFETLPSEGHLTEVGDTVVMLRTSIAGEEQFHVADHYRFRSLIWITLVFFALAIVIGRKRGLTSILGLIFSVSIIAAYIIPGLMVGKNPLTVILIGSFVIALFSIYISHGFNWRSTVALGSTLVTLSLAAILSELFVWWSHLSGLGSEEAFYVQIGVMDMNMKGVLLGGIVLGTLGVLDDVTMAQSASVDEIRHANPSLPFAELYRRGLSVGREHIASMVNTLALAYFGAALPLFLLFVMDKARPFWVIVNSEIISEEIIRTLVGSMALVCAVPLSTVFAAYVFSRVGSGFLSRRT